MIFAFIHAGIGWLAASIAALALRNRTANARCWAWRIGLLKGPLALALALPLVVGIRPPDQTTLAVPQRMVQKAVAPIPAPPENLPLTEEAQAPHQATVEPIELPDPWAMTYVLGALIVLTVKIVAARKPHRPMPRVVGVLRPKVVIPTGLEPSSATMALAHEEAHVARRDPQWSLVADLICVLLWFAPPVWLCARSMRAEAEIACDADALRKTGAAEREYARLLLSFVGPAPANALGAPAKRLAQRIEMLNRNPKSLPRIGTLALLTVGLIVMLPWRAIAQHPRVVAPVRSLDQLVPGSLSLDEATEIMLSDPKVKQKIGWTEAQEKAYGERAKRLADAWKPFDDRVAKAEASMSQREAGRVRIFGQEAALDRAYDAAGPIPWTPKQLAALRAIALQRFGGALWQDPEVVGRLRLSWQQRNAVLHASVLVFQGAYAGERTRRKEMPQKIKDQAVWIQHLLQDAKPSERPTLLAKQEKLLAPYALPPLTASEKAAEIALRARKGWAARKKQDQALISELTANQKEKLRALASDPEAWSQPITLVSNQEIPPTAFPLELAAKTLLEEPGVKEKVGWTPAQDEALKANYNRWQAQWNIFAAELYRRQRTMSLRKFFAWDQAERPKALQRAKDASGPFPWTDEQRRSLKSLALARYGTGLWADHEVSEKLALTAQQKSILAQENTAVRKTLYGKSWLPPVIRAAKSVPKKVKLELDDLEKRYLDAAPESRQKLNDRMAMLRSRYAPAYGPLPDSPKTSMAAAKSRRKEADQKLINTLTPAQREKLNRLSTDSGLWQATGKPVFLDYAKGLPPELRQAPKITFQKDPNNPEQSVAIIRRNGQGPDFRITRRIKSDGTFVDKVETISEKP